MTHPQTKNRPNLLKSKELSKCKTVEHAYSLVSTKQKLLLEVKWGHFWSILVKDFTLRSVASFGRTDPGAGRGSFATAPFGITKTILSSIDSYPTHPV